MAFPGADPMTPRAVHRERANQAVIRTGCTPRRNVTWSEFCDLVRAAAGVQEMREELSRGWSNGHYQCGKEQLWPSDRALSPVLDQDRAGQRTRCRIGSGSVAP